MEEIWNDIPDFEGYYQGSNLGRIKSLNYNRTGKEQILKLTKKNSGYLKVNLSKNGKVKNCSVHRLVWMAFNGEIPSGMEINHINEDKTDNRLENLSLMSHKDNINWGTRIERFAKTITGRKQSYEVTEKIRIANTNGKCSKPVLQYDLEGNFIKEWPSARDVERQLGFSSGHISKCCLGKLKSAYGYVWRNKNGE